MKKLVIVKIIFLFFAMIFDISGKEIYSLLWSEYNSSENFKIKCKQFSDSFKEQNEFIFDEDCLSYHVSRNGHIYLIGNYLNSEETARHHNIPYRITRISMPHRMYLFYSGFCADDDNNKIFFSQKVKNKLNVDQCVLCCLDLKTMKIEIIAENNYTHIGTPALSLDGKYLAYYCAKGIPYRLQLDILKLDDKKIFEAAPPSDIIFLYGPNRSAPVWNSENELFIMAKYPSIIPDTPGIFAVKISPTVSVKPIGQGWWPDSNASSKLVFSGYSLRKNDTAVLAYCPKKTSIFELISGATKGKLSADGKFLSCHKTQWITATSKSLSGLIVVDLEGDKSQVLNISRCSVEMNFYWLPIVATGKK